MKRINIRDRGGAIVTIPAQILMQVNSKEGDAIEPNEPGRSPTALLCIPAKARRYTLKELLRGATLRNLAVLKRQTAGALGGARVGREVA